jgi:hypothetical protein
VISRKRLILRDKSHFLQILQDYPSLALQCHRTWKPLSPQPDLWTPQRCPEQCHSVQVRSALGSAAADPLGSRNREAARAANVLGAAAAATNAAGSGSAAMRGAAALQSIKQLVAGIKLRRDTAREGAHRTSAQVCGAKCCRIVKACRPNLVYRCLSSICMHHAHLNLS